MSLERTRFEIGSLISVFLGGLILIVAYLALSGQAVPILGTNQAVAIFIGLVGFAMCSLGGLAGKVNSLDFAWLDVCTVSGVILGIVALGLVVAIVTDAALPLALTHSESVGVLVGIIGLKWIISRSHSLRLG